MCDCCEINDYDPYDPEDDDPDDQDLWDSPVPGSCRNCDHSPEEHGL